MTHATGKTTEQRQSFLFLKIACVLKTDSVAFDSEYSFPRATLHQGQSSGKPCVVVGVIGYTIGYASGYRDYVADTA